MISYTDVKVTELKPAELFRVVVVGTVNVNGQSKFFGVEINPFADNELNGLPEPFRAAIEPHIADARKLGGTPLTTQT